ncbi:hypothetical protein HY636_02295 [Candidatus Woesearchaeota archaeon]|nr:hypothetical protein [Candidatus Woesearchaeota archaeon]
MAKPTLERIISALVKPIIGLGIMGTILAFDPSSANAQTTPTTSNSSDATSSSVISPDAQSTEMDTSGNPNTSTTNSTDTADAEGTPDADADSFEALEANARENCKNTTLELKLQSVEQYVKNEGRNKKESTELSRFLKKTEIKVCSDKEFTDDLNRVYEQLNKTIGFVSEVKYESDSRIDIDYVTKNYETLKKILKEASPAQIRHNLDYFQKLFSKDKKKLALNFLKKHPDDALALCLGEAPEKYIPALKKMIGKTDGTSVYIAMIGLFSDPANMSDISYRLSALKRKGFKNVSETEISDLLRGRNFKRIETLSKPALLYDNLGIIQFGWFSTELLERTIYTIEHPQEKPAAIYVLTRQPEINGMMVTPETNDDYVLGELKDYAPIAIQPGANKKLGEVLTYLHRRGIRAKNITFHLHGLQDQMLVDGYGDDSYLISKDTMSEWLEPLNQILTDDATIILSSCLTGKGEDNIARDIALATHRRTYAPSEEMMAGMFWYVSPDEVYLGRAYKMEDEDRKTFTPPKRENKFRGLASSAFDKVIDLTKRYYFPKEDKK